MATHSEVCYQRFHLISALKSTLAQRVHFEQHHYPKQWTVTGKISPSGTQRLEQSMNHNVTIKWGVCRCVVLRSAPLRLDLLSPG